MDNVYLFIHSLWRPFRDTPKQTVKAKRKKYNREEVKKDKKVKPKIQINNIKSQ